VLFLLEAMKMEISVAAPRNGIVEKVFCKAGDTVPQGELLASLSDPAKKS